MRGFSVKKSHTFADVGWYTATGEIAIGMITGSVLMRLMKTLLFGASPLDPVTFIAVPLILAAAAAAVATISQLGGPQVSIR